MTKKFGERIHEIRKERELTLKQLADRLDVGITYLSKIENDRTGSTPSKETVEKLADKLGVNEETKQELFHLAKRVPPDLERDIANRKALLDVCRSAKALTDAELRHIEKEIKELKEKNAEDTKK